ncbi:MAG: hypothetical protein CMM47_11375 [Rhodospirillaceae bacterium]|nr:hypothetical protein [Rhodospirillaceae bacterium]
MTDQPINVTDLIILAVVLISGFLGFFRGFIHMTLSITAKVAAVFAGIYGYPLLAPNLSPYIPEPSLVPWASGFVIGLGTVIMLSVIAHYLAKALRLEGLGGIDRSLGFLFGLTGGAFLVSLTLLIFQWVIDDQDYPEWLADAKSMPLARSGADLLVRLLPVDLRPPKKEMDAQAQKAARDLVLERLVSPPVKSNARPDRSGYTEEERDAMNRAIKSSR